MDHGYPKENVPMKEPDRMLVEPSKRGLVAPHVASLDKLATEPAEPRASIETLCSLDISDNIPKIVFPMDTEDSPWGGRSRRLRCQSLQNPN